MNFEELPQTTLAAKEARLRTDIALPESADWGLRINDPARRASVERLLNETLMAVLRQAHAGELATAYQVVQAAVERVDALDREHPEDKIRYAHVNEVMARFFGINYSPRVYEQFMLHQVEPDFNSPSFVQELDALTALHGMPTDAAPH